MSNHPPTPSHALRLEPASPSVQAEHEVRRTQWTQKSMTEMKAEGLDTLDAVIRKYPGVGVRIDLAALDDPVAGPHARELFDLLVREGLAHIEGDDGKVYTVAAPDTENEPT